MPTRSLEATWPAALQRLPEPVPHDDTWHHRLLASAVATRLGGAPEQVFPSLGTSGANASVLSLLLASGGELLCEAPYYDPLWRSGAVLGAQLRFFQRAAGCDWQIDPLAVEAALDHGTRVVAISRPHNPTGADTPEPVLVRLGEMAEAHDIHVLVDEVYLEFLPQARPAFLLHPRLISTCSLTKTHGLGQHRVGWVATTPGLVEELQQRRLHAEALLPTLPFQLALANWQQLDSWRDQARARASQGAAVLHQALQGVPELRLSPFTGAPLGFAWLGVDEQPLVQALEQRGVGVTPGACFGATGGVRLGFTASPEGLATAARILREEIDELLH